MIIKCKHCGKEIDFKNHQQYGAHITNCEKNPKRNETREKRANTVRAKFEKFKFNCIKCGKEYELELNIVDFKNGKYRKTCCSSCANSKKHSKETIEKIRKSLLKFLDENGHLGGFYKKHRPDCKVCGKKVKKPYQKYCSVKCAHESPDIKKRMSEVMMERIRKNPEMHPNRLCAGIKESYPEKMAREYFEQNGLIKNKDFIQQFGIDIYHVDFYFPFLNLCIEIDGKRWHDPNSEKEIARENKIKEKHKLKRFDAYKMVKKKYQKDLDKIIKKAKTIH